LRVCSFEKSNKRSIALSERLSDQKSDRSYEMSDKRAIAQSLFSKEGLSDGKSDRSFEMSKKEQ